MAFIEQGEHRRFYAQHDVIGEVVVVARLRANGSGRAVRVESIARIGWNARGAVESANTADNTDRSSGPIDSGCVRLGRSGLSGIGNDTGAYDVNGCCRKQKDSRNPHLRAVLSGRIERTTLQ